MRASETGGRQRPLFPRRPPEMVSVRDTCRCRGWKIQSCWRWTPGEGSCLWHDDGRYVEVLISVLKESERARSIGLGVDEDINCWNG